MGKRGTNERKAIGGLARSQALSPERRQEIARKAAASRWGTERSGALPRKSAAVRMLKGLASVKRLTVCSQAAPDDAGPAVTTVTLLEGEHVLRTFSGMTESVEACVEAYLAALRDIGIELHLTHTLAIRS